MNHSPDVPTDMLTATRLPPPPSDRQLLDAVRRGSDVAWTELLARHRPAVDARQRGRHRRQPLAPTLHELRLGIERDLGPAVGDQAIRAFRPRLVAAFSGGTYGPAGGHANDAAELLATAFARLPEPWQTALWHRHVELVPDSGIAPLVGRDPDDVAGLFENARRGLAHAFLVECDGDRPVADEVEPLAVTIDRHLADAIAPRLTGSDIETYRRSLARSRVRRRARRV